MKQPIKVLLIGAGSDMRCFLKPLMTRNGYEVAETPGGISGLTQAHDHKPDLILLNVALPDSNSFVVCKQIKAVPALNGIFVVLISEEAVSWEDRSAGLAVGADEYLAIPTTSRDLFSWVQAIVRVQQAEKKLRASEQRFRALVERSADANALLNSEGIFLYASPSTNRVLGFTSEELNLQSVLQSPQINGVAERVKESIDIVEQLIEQLHGLALDLRPPMLDDLGLIPALRWYANHQSQRASLCVVFNADSIPTRLDPGTEAACYWVGQEAVTNVVRHAHASEMTIQLKLNHDSLHLSVRDDGVGFDLTDQFRTEASSLKLGLLGMKERVSLVGGRIEFKSNPGQGTEVQAWFPKLSAREIAAGVESSSPGGDSNSVRLVREPL